MQDTFGRTVSYIRVSVTDRCDFRCHYCMAEHMTFLPRRDLLSIEELDRVCSAFISLGVRKLRLTGGEPLVRRGIMTLVKDLSRHLESGALDELTMTTNGTQLARHAADLAALGMRRINISLDTLNPETFRSITRLGTIEQTLSGISAARDAGLAIKINTVALRGINEHEIADMVAWCGREGYDMTLIETMPLGDIGGDRSDHYLPLSQVRQDLERRFTLTPSSHNTGGPSRYVDVQETQRRVGFITPLTEHFCDTCNRVRLTCTGTLYMCLGQEDSVDLRQPLRANESNQPLLDAIATAIARKPRGHDFVIDKSHRGPALTRHMNTTGG